MHVHRYIAAGGPGLAILDAKFIDGARNLHEVTKH